MWSDTYSRPNRPKTPPPEAIFPRYLVLDAILVAVQEIDSDRLPVAPELAALLRDAGGSAEDDFTRNLAGNPVAMGAMAEERAFFVQAIEQAFASGLGEQEPLPYCRTLGAAELDGIRSRLQAAWGVREPPWIPMTRYEHEPPPTLVWFALDSLDEARKQQLQEDFQAFCLARGVERLYLLTEDGPHFQVAAAEARLDGLYEAFLVPDSMEWIAYGSHHSTVTLAGPVAEIAPRASPAT